ncbi:hypothetical protein LCGC14_0944460 [marine sediment metagenome]|uniref:Uncharacterized protein n=1 Tax=marine sediment metagenome TaxID=412755 RepID=A0A0F9NJ32_9ZZZZ
MELLTKTRDELKEYAGKMQLKYAKNISDDNLRNLVEMEAIKRTVEIEERARLKLQQESKMRLDLAEIRAEADIRGVTIDIPKEPTLTDIARLKKELDIIIKEPKPSPETLAIESSKKVYAIFRNLEQDDMDVLRNPGGKHWFHFWPDKVHVIPEWLIGYYRKTATVPRYEKKTVRTLETAQIQETIEKVVRTKDRQRFSFEVLGDAPDDASFGIVTDSQIISSLEQTV